MAKARRKKKRTQRDVQPDPAKKGVPKSFVWAQGSKRSLVRELCADLRAVMQPHTAAKLKVSHRNVLKDFVHVAGPLGVTHFVVLTATDKASYLKLCKSPRGPTAVLKILEYSHMRDVLAAQRHPRRPDAAFLHPPLVVLQGFTGEQHMKLTAVLFQNMFPAINVTKAKLAECQRVVLLVHNKAKDTISMRHFNVSVAPSGLTKGVKALVSGKAPPDLSGFADVADFVERAGYASESEGEDAAAGRVELGQALGRNNAPDRTSRVRLHEMGPRLELQLLKVQEGLAEGRVLYHRYEQRSTTDAAEQQIAVDDATRLRAERRRQQEENVRNKAREKARVAAAQQAEQEKKLAKRQREDAKGATGGKLPKRAKGAKKNWWEDDGSDAAVEEDDDAAQYEREVGEKPDEHFGVPTAAATKPHRAEKRGGKAQGAKAPWGQAGVKKPARAKSKHTKPKKSGAG